MVLKKTFLRWIGVFFHLNGGRGSQYGELAKKGCEWGGFNFKKLNCILILARLYSCMILILLLCPYYYIETLFLKNFQNVSTLCFVNRIFSYTSNMMAFLLNLEILWFLSPIFLCTFENVFKCNIIMS